MVAKLRWPSYYFDEGQPPDALLLHGTFETCDGLDYLSVQYTGSGYLVGPIRGIVPMGERLNLTPLAWGQRTSPSSGACIRFDEKICVTLRRLELDDHDPCI